VTQDPNCVQNRTSSLEIKSLDNVVEIVQMFCRSIETISVKVCFCCML